MRSRNDVRAGSLCGTPDLWVCKCEWQERTRGADSGRGRGVNGFSSQPDLNSCNGLWEASETAGL